MSYTVSTEAYQGPFDLLLRLVARQKIDIGAISITQIAEQYLAEVERMHDLDLDVASDFVVVAAALLKIKLSSLLSKEVCGSELNDGDEDELTPEQSRDILVARLFAYKQFKNAAAALGARMENEGRMHPRHAGLEPQFLGLVPDYLKDVSLDSLAALCAGLLARRDTFLLEAEHIAAVPISMEQHVEKIYRTMKSTSVNSFDALVGPEADAELVVVTFMAILELYKRGVVSLTQADAFDDIVLEMEPDAPEITDFTVPDWGMPEDRTLQTSQDVNAGTDTRTSKGANASDASKTMPISCVKKDSADRSKTLHSKE